MRIIIQRNSSPIISLILCLSLIFGGCQPDKPQLTGKWTGKPVENCPNNMFSNGVTTVNYEFSNDGSCLLSFEGNNGVDDAVINFPQSKYEFTTDSLILIFTENVYSRHAFKYEMKDADKIVLSRNFTRSDDPISNCTSVTELSRVDN